LFFSSNSSANKAVAITALKEMLFLINSTPLEKSFFDLLLGGTDEEFDLSLKRTLIASIESEDEVCSQFAFHLLNVYPFFFVLFQSLSIAGLKFFEALLSLFHQDVAFKLFYQKFLTKNHLERDEDNDNDIQSLIGAYELFPPQLDFTHSPFLLGRFLILIPGSDFSISSLGYDAYLKDAEYQILSIMQKCVHWVPFEAQLKLEPESSPLTDKEKVKEFHDGGLFLNALFNKLERFFQNSLNENLILTGIIAKLAQHPLPLLRSFLLWKNLPLRKGVRSLWAVLSKVKKETKTHNDAHPLFFLFHFAFQLSKQVEERSVEIGKAEFHHCLMLVKQGQTLSNNNAE
jgi:hypothetical protein